MIQFSEDIEDNFQEVNVLTVFVQGTAMMSDAYTCTKASEVVVAP